MLVAPHLSIYPAGLWTRRTRKMAATGGGCKAKADFNFGHATGNPGAPQHSSILLGHGPTWYLAFCCCAHARPPLSVMFNPTQRMSRWCADLPGPVLSSKGKQ